MATTAKPTPAAETPAAKAQRIYKRALALHQAGELTEAIKGYAQALKFTPLSSDIYNNLGVALRAIGRPHAALACYRRSLAITPGTAGVYTNMGNALADMDEPLRAVEAHRRAVKHAPKSAKVLFNAGRAFVAVGQTKSGRDHFSQAIALQPNYAQARVHHARALLRLGDWTAGFKELEARFKLPNQDPRRKDIPMWDGKSPKDKTILINFEGDEGTLVQYLRFARSLKKAGARVIVECPAHFNALLKASPDIDDTPNLGAPVTGVDAQIPLLSLPRFLGSQTINIPAPEGYLEIPKSGAQTLNIHPEIRLAVGLAWSGDWAGRSKSDPVKPGEVKLDDLTELFGIPAVQLVSLELGPGAADIDRLGLQPLIDQVGPSIMDVADMASMIEQLDLVICVDSVAAHLAGAMGKPVWMLCGPDAHWSWLEDRNDSPWYASLSLFRKSADHSWSDIVTTMRQSLMTILKGTA